MEILPSSTASSNLSNPVVSIVGGGTTNAFDEILKATPPALVAFLASLPAVEGNFSTIKLGIISKNTCFDCSYQSETSCPMIEKLPLLSFYASFICQPCLFNYANCIVNQNLSYAKTRILNTGYTQNFN